jgi:hypothetical protein
VRWEIGRENEGPSGMCGKAQMEMASVAKKKGRRRKEGLGDRVGSLAAVNPFSRQKGPAMKGGSSAHSDVI